MELKTISAAQAQSNVDKYFKEKEEKEEQEKVQQMQKIFDIIAEHSKKGWSCTDIKLSTINNVYWYCLCELLDKLGYEYSVKSGSGISQPYIHISWG